MTNRNLQEQVDIWNPKYPIKPNTPVVTYGSCFAQHIGRALKARGYSWLETEVSPFGMRAQTARSFGYSVFSSRSGNIYTPTYLRQWTEWALGKNSAPDICWYDKGRAIDPFRPRIEPHGFEDKEEMLRCREMSLEAFRESIRRAGVLVFTLGLTERWLDKAGFEYPMCPGTAAGEFDPEMHFFDNLDYAETTRALNDVTAMFRAENPELKILLTVSPVPLTATASQAHVMAATVRSKSILRAAADSVVANDEMVDYFPSYEIFSSPVFGRGLFEPNWRSVSADGVRQVMDLFFRAQVSKFGEVEVNLPEEDDLYDLICEEEILDFFGAER
ncbi:GSCFA domain-containing protein [Thalassovita sp.]|uniref:GSCFA domain-containing protein n=1 Tax=Thalassovita sp. TaxID=1979401 RepID=UPI002B272A8B|nr:GSCFA domain-containing protein [Thalassovita sp.]